MHDYITYIFIAVPTYIFIVVAFSQHTEDTNGQSSQCHTLSKDVLQAHFFKGHLKSMQLSQEPKINELCYGMIKPMYLALHSYFVHDKFLLISTLLHCQQLHSLGSCNFSGQDMKYIYKLYNISLSSPLLAIGSWKPAIKKGQSCYSHATHSPITLTLSQPPSHHFLPTSLIIPQNDA